MIFNRYTSGNTNCILRELAGKCIFEMSYLMNMLFFIFCLPGVLLDNNPTVTKLVSCSCSILWLLYLVSKMKVFMHRLHCMAETYWSLLPNWNCGTNYEKSAGIWNINGMKWWKQRTSMASVLFSVSVPRKKSSFPSHCLRWSEAKIDISNVH